MFGIPDPLRPGFILSVDNALAPQMDGKPTVPFYDAGGKANGTAFLDTPENPLNQSTQLIFHTFAVTAAGKAYTIYDDVTWGVQTVVPEPGSLVMLTIGGGCALVGRWRWKRLAA
jgi:PEP-CTERM motif